MEKREEILKRLNQTFFSVAQENQALLLQEARESVEHLKDSKDAALLLASLTVSLRLMGYALEAVADELARMSEEPISQSRVMV